MFVVECCEPMAVTSGCDMFQGFGQTEKRERVVQGLQEASWRRWLCESQVWPALIPFSLIHFKYNEAAPEHSDKPSVMFNAKYLCIVRLIGLISCSCAIACSSACRLATKRSTSKQVAMKITSNKDKEAQREVELLTYLGSDHSAVCNLLDFYVKVHR